ncbi:MAG: hypothetical protein ACYCO3_01290 [Mycobacteriales bacterium]
MAEIVMGKKGEHEDVLAHSGDDGEWEDAPVEIERRPTGKQVMSARLSQAAALALMDMAAERGVRPSDIVREAVDEYLHTGSRRRAQVQVLMPEKSEYTRVSWSAAPPFHCPDMTNPVETEPPNLVSLLG